MILGPCLLAKGDYIAGVGGGTKSAPKDLYNMTNDNSWYKLSGFDLSGTRENFLERAFMAKALESKKAVKTAVFSKSLTNISDFNRLKSELEEMLDKKFKRFSEAFSYKEKNSELKLNYIDYYDEETLCSIDTSNKRIKRVYLNIKTFKDSIIPEIKEFFDKFESKYKESEEVDQSSEIFVMISSQTGISFSNVGQPKEKLVETNYPQDVLDSFDYISDQLQQQNPDGRLVIYHGEPGTGKTFLIEGIMDRVKNSIFVLVPSDYLASLNNPNFLPALIDLKDEIGFENEIGEEGEDDFHVELNRSTSVDSIFYDDEDLETWDDILESQEAEAEEKKKKRKHGSIILVVEDADANLAKRDGFNSNIISSVLNFADGILGRSLDLRIICTTNLESMELDEAIERPGRLLKKVYVGKLSEQEAIRCYRNILNMSEEEQISDENLKILKRGVSVAEVYKLANNEKEAKAVLKKKETKKFGF